jgi:hypothetical protein
MARWWDWSTSSKKGVLKVDLPPGAKLKSGRFINELSATAVVMAEDSEPAPASSRNDSLLVLLDREQLAPGLDNSTVQS